MGNCAGCAGPQRTYQVERLYENSPIKNRLSGNKYYEPSDSGLKSLPIGERDKVVERTPWNQNQMIGGVFGLAHSKSRPTSLHPEPYSNLIHQSPNNLYTTQKNAYDSNNNLYSANNNFYAANSFQPLVGDFTKDLLSQAVRTTNIKLYPDNPENLKQASPQLQKSFLYQRQEDLHNSRIDPLRKSNSIQSYSNQLLKSVQTESKKYLRGDYSSQQRIHHINHQSPPMEHILARFDDISEIRTESISKRNHEEGSMPLKKYSKHNRGLTVIEQILQQDHKTPLDIRRQRKNNGEDVIFDTFEGFSQQIEPLQIPNFSPYLSVLKQIVQKS